MTNPSISRPLSRQQFEIAIVCAIPLEYDAVANLLDECWDEGYGRAQGDPNTYTTGAIGSFNVVILLLPGTGKVWAATSAASLRSSFPGVRLVFLSGTCGGVPNAKGKEVLLGDVIISKTVVQYDIGDQYPDAFKTKNIIEERLDRANKDIRGSTTILETDLGSYRLEERAAFYLDVIQNQPKKGNQRRPNPYAYPGSSNDKLFEAGYCHKHHISPKCECSNGYQEEGPVCEESRELSCDQLGCDYARLVPRSRLEEKKRFESSGNIKDAQAPSIFIGRVGSGDTAIKSGVDRDRLAREHDILAFEMEGSGFWDEFPCIIVKGICHYADSHDNKDWQNFAAATAASVVKGLIERYPKTDHSDTSFLATLSVSAKMEDSKENRACLRDLVSTDPADEKKRIQMTKGGLLRDAYAWILTNDAFQKWHNDPQCPLLWIRGDPGKGKTMLLCGIVDELEKSATHNLAYFFCQQIDPRLNHSVAILRGLISMLVRKQPSLMPYIRAKYDDVGKAVFEGPTAWVALSGVLTSMLQDPSLKDTILIIDALDECSQGLHQILDLIEQSLSLSTHVKFLVSSRNELDIQRRLEGTASTSRLSLELNSTSVAAAIASYIQYKVRGLRVDDDLQAEIEEYLTKHADGTFLWVALACDNLKTVPAFEIRSALAAFPPGLDHVYERMLKKICGPTASDLGRRILLTILVVHRPLTILELTTLVDFPGEIGENEQALNAVSEQIMGLCGSFLVLKDQTFYFVHQSAKDFLMNKAHSISPLGNVHRQIFSASLSKMEMTLKKDIYGLVEPGCSIYEIPAMNSDPLASVRYSCVFWIDHFLSSFPKDSSGMGSNESYYTLVGGFFRKKYLYWLEALALLRNIPQGVIKMQKLEKQARKTEVAALVKYLISDACRFIQKFAEAIQYAPLQTYVSALLFSPHGSLIRRLFEKDTPKWVDIGPKLEPYWRPRMLEGHLGAICSIAISCNGDRLLSRSEDQTIKIWDTESGICLRTISCDDGCHGAVFSPLDGDELASYHQGSITLWNLAKDGNQKNLRRQKEYFESQVFSISFSPTSQNILAVDCSTGLEVWNTATCELIWMRPERPSGPLVFSINNDSLAWYSSEMHTDTVYILDLITGKIIHSRTYSKIRSIIFSTNCDLLVVLQPRGYIELHDSMMNKLIMRFRHGEGHDFSNACFSADSSLLAARIQTDIWIWETASGKLVQKIIAKNHDIGTFLVTNEQIFIGLKSGNIVVLNIDGAKHTLPRSLNTSDPDVWSKFSPNGNCFIRGYENGVVLWDCISQTSTYISTGRSPMISPDSMRLACSQELCFQIWSICPHPPRILFQKNFAGFFTYGLATLSQDWKQLAILSTNGTINIWDTSSGYRLFKLKQSVVEQMMLLFSLDKKRLAGYSFKSKRYEIWDIESGKSSTTTFQEVDSPESFNSFILAPRYIFHIEGLFKPCDDYKDILTKTTVVFGNLGLPANESSYKIVEGNAWVTSNDKRVLWLPPNYRPAKRYQWDTTGRVIGFSTCEALVIEFCCDTCPTELTNTSNQTTCKANFTGRYKNIGKTKDAPGGDNIRSLIGLFGGII